LANEKGNRNCNSSSSDKSIHKHRWRFERIDVFVICCSDVDECKLGLSDCTQICKNTLGSFTCACQSGFQLSTDNKSCFSMWPWQTYVLASGWYSSVSALLGPNLQRILRQSCDKLTTNRKLRTSYANRLIYKETYDKDTNILLHVLR